MNDIPKRIDDPKDFNQNQSETASFITDNLISGKIMVDFNDYSENTDFLMWISENEKIYFLNESDLTYISIDLPEETKFRYGLYGKAREDYLKSENKELYNELTQKGTLKRYLAELDKQASDLEETMIEQMSASEGITAELKMNDMFEWVGRYNNLKNRVRE